jgi:hypothetical protein
MCEIDAIEKPTGKVDFKVAYSLEHGNQPDLIAENLTKSPDLGFALLDSWHIIQEVHT